MGVGILMTIKAQSKNQHVKKTFFLHYPYIQMYKTKAEWKSQSAANLLIHPLSLQALTLGKEPATPVIYSVWVESMLTGLDFWTMEFINTVGMWRQYIILVAAAAVILCVHSYKGL